MRSWLLVLSLGVACAPEAILDCRCISPGVPRELVEGSFLHAIDAVEVLQGDYVPPPLPPPVPAAATSSEDYLVWLLGEEQLVVRAVWIDARPDPDADGGCCPGWEGLALTAPQPRWNERSRVRPEAPDLGGAIGRLDPTLASVEPTFLAATDVVPFELDGDGGGFVLRADYYVQPAGCADASCAAVVRVTHHFRRA